LGFYKGPTASSTTLKNSSGGTVTITDTLSKCIDYCTSVSACKYFFRASSASDSASALCTFYQGTLYYGTNSAYHIRYKT
jgi:hypothetical protein